MKTGFGHGYHHKSGNKYYKYHGIWMPCNIEEEIDTFYDYDTELEGILIKLDMTTISYVYRSMVDKNENWAAGPGEIAVDNETDYLKTYNVGWVSYNVEKFSDKYAPLGDVEKFNYLYVRSKVKAVMNYTPCRSWIAPDECDPGKIINGYLLKTGSTWPYFKPGERQALPNKVKYTLKRYFRRNEKDDRDWWVSDLDKLGVQFYLRDCYPTWPAWWKQNWAFIYYLELWVHVLMKP